MPKCPECGQENAEGTPLCRECGASIPQPSSQEVTADTSSDDAELLGLLRDGKKIQAIKVYRERYGVGLKEAKDAVEAMASQHGIASQGSGCAGVVLLGLVGLAAGAWCLLA